MGYANRKVLQIPHCTQEIKTANKTNKQNKQAKNKKKAKLIKAVNIHCDFGVLISRPVIPIGSTKTFIIS